MIRLVRRMGLVAVLAMPPGGTTLAQTPAEANALGEAAQARGEIAAARAWYLRAAETGDPVAQTNLATLIF
ncbi:MAG TPA: hypothetical protein VGC80_04615, partial [Acetobacteraceae bacterium]